MYIYCDNLDNAINANYKNRSHSIGKLFFTFTSFTSSC